MRLISLLIVILSFRASAQVDKYSINLMWINRSFNPEQTYIRLAKDENELIQKLILPVCKWAKMNPEADVILWYDGAMVDAASVARTKIVLDNQLKEWGNAKAQLRDLREIPVFAANPDAFSDRTPVYLRIDLLKFVIVLDSIERKGTDAAIFADLEIGDLREDGLRMGKDELFNPEVISQLNDLGLVIGNGLENQFIQVINNERITEAIKHVIINVNLARMQAALNYVGPRKFWVMQELWKGAFHSTREDVWRYIQAKSTGRVRVCPSIGKCDRSELVDWNPKIHGYSQWGLYFFHPDCDGVSTIVNGKCHESLIRMPTDVYISAKRATRSDLEVRDGNTHSGDMNQFVEREGLQAEVQVVFWE